METLYSVLLVDDEEDVLRVMKKKLPWEELGFEISGMAANGIEALAMAEELQPDVVLTDVQMPYMDGLTLCRQLKESHSGIKVVIFSGFDEFEYAKEAIRAAAEEYILKPINAADLREIFIRIKKTLDRERDETRNLEKLKEYYEKSLPILQEGFFTALFEGRIAEKELKETADSYQVSFSGKYYVVSIFHIGREGMKKIAGNPTLLGISLKNMAEEEIPERFRFRLQIYSGEVVLVTELSDESQLRDLTDILGKFAAHATRLFNCPVTAGIGTVCESPLGLKASFESARDAVSYRRIYGASRAISMNEVKREMIPDGGEKLTELSVSAILKAIRLGSETELNDAISEYEKKLFSSDIGASAYRVLILELVCAVGRFAIESGIRVEKAFDYAGHEKDIFELFRFLDDRDRLEDWIREVCLELRKNLKESRKKNTLSFVTQAETFIAENYSTPDLGVDEVCRHLNISSAYFSSIFKKETGKTFVTYLTDIRMEKAAEMLIAGNEKTYIVAEAVGFTDPNYFSYVFKKQYGVSPSKYRALTEK